MWQPVASRAQGEFRGPLGFAAKCLLGNVISGSLATVAIGEDHNTDTLHRIHGHARAHHHRDCAEYQVLTPTRNRDLSTSVTSVSVLQDHHSDIGALPPRPEKQPGHRLGSQRAHSTCLRRDALRNRPAIRLANHSSTAMLRIIQATSKPCRHPYPRHPTSNNAIIR